MLTFKEFPKIPRLKRELCITEKIDGTNAAIIVQPMSEDNGVDLPIAIRSNLIDQHGVDLGAYGMWAQSRSRFIRPEADNYGFASWVQRNSEQLFDLGHGEHFGEWWGNGIQRNYGQDRKRFSLFNAARWNPKHMPPACCEVVPILGRGTDENLVELALSSLRSEGSRAAPGFMKPEGIIVWHSAAQSYFKVTLEKDSEPKTKA